MKPFQTRQGKARQVGWGGVVHGVAGFRVARQVRSGAAWHVAVRSGTVWFSKAGEVWRGLAG